MSPLLVFAVIPHTAQAGTVENTLSAFVADEQGYATELPAAGLSAKVGAEHTFLAGRAGLGGIGIRLAKVDLGAGLEDVLPAAPRTLSCAPVPLADPAGDCIPAVQRDLGLVQEWWQAPVDGIQQGWTIEAAGEQVILDVRLDGAVVVEVDGLDAWVTDETGRDWTVSGIAAWDANGTVLPITVSAMDQPGIRLSVDTTDARFPVTVDPIYSTADATLSGDSASDFYGVSVDGAGDINGDGFDDLVVGGNRADSYVGRAWVYYGSASGLSTTADHTLSPPTTGQFGFDVAGLGDIDGDGYPEVGVGAPFTDSRRGAVYIYSGSATGLDTTPTIVPGPVSGGYFGLALDGGDVNADGYADLVASSYCYSGCTGRVYVFEGSASGLASSPSTTLTGPHSTSYYGQALASGGDINGDGYDDVAIGAYGANSDHGQLSLHLGSATGLKTTAHDTLTGSSGQYLARGVAMGGDLNADGYDEVAWSTGLGGGAVHVSLGTPSGPDLGAPLSLSGGWMGLSTVIRDDSDGDGYGELLVGEPSGGTVRIHPGDASGLSLTAQSTLSGSGGAGYYGTAVADAGDLNGDGIGDVAVGAPGEASTGQVHIYLGYADLDLDGLPADEDCDDTDPDLGPELPGFMDADGDGFGDGSTHLYGCPGDPAWTDVDGDCDDDDAATFPGAPEVVGDGVDQSCDGVEECFVDADDDGHATTDAITALSLDTTCDAAGLADASAPADDCDDSDPDTFPGATDIPGDGIDQDCDGADAQDSDTGDTGIDDTGQGDTGTGTGGTDKGTGCSTVGGAGWLASGWLAIVGLLGARRRDAGIQ